MTLVAQITIEQATAFVRAIEIAATCEIYEVDMKAVSIDRKRDVLLSYSSEDSKITVRYNELNHLSRPSRPGFDKSRPLNEGRHQALPDELEFATIQQFKDHFNVSL